MTHSDEIAGYEVFFISNLIKADAADADYDSKAVLNPRKPYAKSDRSPLEYFSW